MHEQCGGPGTCGGASQPLTPPTAAGAPLTVDIQHHLPKRRPDGLMEAKPHLSAPAQRVGAALGRREEGAAHGGVPGTGALSREAGGHTPRRRSSRPPVSMANTQGARRRTSSREPRTQGSGRTSCSPRDPPTAMPRPLPSGLHTALHLLLGWGGQGCGCGRPQSASRAGPARASGRLARRAKDLTETKHPGPVPFPPGSSMGGRGGCRARTPSRGAARST